MSCRMAVVWGIVNSPFNSFIFEKKQFFCKNDQEWCNLILSKSVKKNSKVIRFMFKSFWHFSKFILHFQVSRVISQSIGLLSFWKLRWDKLWPFVSYLGQLNQNYRIGKGLKKFNENNLWKLCMPAHAVVYIG